MNPIQNHRAARCAACVLVWLCLHAWSVCSATEYRIARAESELRILAFRAGPLASLGHNHVVVTRELSGTVDLEESAANSSVKFAFPVISLDVDEAAVRAEEGADFTRDVSAKDIAATRRNMLGPRLLDADNHPIIRVESTSFSGEPPNVTMTASIMLKGGRHLIEIPVSINTFDGGLVAIGRLRLNQTALGLTPFEAALGSLRVADEMLIKFRIVARPPARSR